MPGSCNGPLICGKCDEQVGTHCDGDEEKFATASWNISDVQTLFDVTDEEAEKFLMHQDSTIRDLMVDRGWEAIGTLGAIDGLKPVEADND